MKTHLLNTSAACFLAASLCSGFTFNSTAQTLTLFDWGFNIDSTIYTPSGPALPGYINTAGFDFSSGLGTVTASITGPGLHYFSMFVDQEIDEAINTFFNEYGEAVNTPVAAQSWEIDEPGYVFGDIYDNFLNATLDNLNAIPAATPDDVSMALGWDFAVGAGETATITMFLSDSPPPGGFYLSQTDPDTQYSVYFSSTLRMATDGGDHEIPDGGSSFACLAFALGGLAALRRKL